VCSSKLLQVEKHVLSPLELGTVSLVAIAWKAQLALACYLIRNFFLNRAFIYFYLKQKLTCFAVLDQCLKDGLKQVKVADQML
jgi:hypothetical protein